MEQDCSLAHLLVLFFRHLTPQFLKHLWPLSCLPMAIFEHACVQPCSPTPLLMFALANADRIGDQESPYPGDLLWLLILLTPIP